MQSTTTTPATLPTKDRLQIIFDRVCNHFGTMEKPSICNDFGGCAYRSSDGEMCFVGALIPDDEYQPLFEGIGMSTGNRTTKDLRAKLFSAVSKGLGFQISIASPEATLLTRLQEVHDAWDPSHPRSPHALAKIYVDLCLAAERNNLNADSAIAAIQQQVQCPRCEGEGEIWAIAEHMSETQDGYDPCDECGGSGKSVDWEYFERVVDELRQKIADEEE